MNRYEGAQCPVCHRKLTAEDDIVVCPECGAPHHRSCWQELGHCGCADRHAAHWLWQPENAPAADAPAQPAPDEPHRSTAQPEAPGNAPQTGSAKICPRCGAQNTPDARFCLRCGAPLVQTGAPQFAVVLDPLGGVPPEEEIDGVPAKKMAQIVDRNSAYYLPRFRAMATGQRKAFPNLSAFLFDIPWFFYRKLYFPGIAVLLIELAMAAPSGWAFYQMLRFGADVSFSDGFWTLYYVCTALQLVFRTLIGLFANSVYRRRCAALGRELMQVCPDDESFAAAAGRRGGVAQVFFYISAALIGLYYLLQLIIYWIL